MSLSIHELRIKIFADGADIQGILKAADNPLIKGFTTNPTLMRKAGITDYEGFGRRLLEAIPDRPISFEVFADDFLTMERQALKMASWGENVNVKIPITNTKGQSSIPLIERLSKNGVKLNITAITTHNQVQKVVDAISPGSPTIVSIFAGRIADTGIDPVPYMEKAKQLLAGQPKAELLWASPRELLNVFQADAIGCNIITVTNDILKKLHLIGKDLETYSLETVNMFYQDAMAAGYTIMDLPTI